MFVGWIRIRSLAFAIEVMTWASLHCFIWFKNCLKVVEAIFCFMKEKKKKNKLSAEILEPPFPMCLPDNFI